jgi:hypothetical protein
LTTGYSASLTVERAKAAGIRLLLLKPTTLLSLGNAVHRAINPQLVRGSNPPFQI